MQFIFKLLTLMFVFAFATNNVKSDKVPVILWNINGNSLHVISTPAFRPGDIIFDDSIHSILSQNANVLVFALDQFSAEDFSAVPQKDSNSTLQNLQKYLDTQRYMFLSTVNKPLTSLHKVHCGIQEIVVDQTIDENVLKAISLAFSRSCVVILHITDIGIFGSKDHTMEEIKNVFEPRFEKSTKPIVGIFTSDKSSWTGSNVDHHRSRNILQAEEAEADNNFINITGCIYMYIESAQINVGKGNNTVQLPLPADTAGSSCDNGTAVLQLAFKLSGEITGVTIKFEFKNKMGSWVTEANIAVSGEKAPQGELPTYSDFIEAPMRKSFNCGNLRLRTKNNTDVVVTMKGFQVQPFPVSDKFSESFDCVTFFTVPIWTGVFVSILFIVIINVGIYALFSIHTMDRFDDPKGKTISVALGSE